MRKLFLFLFAALMSVGMYATTVTWYNNDITGSGYGTSFTKDGVTITAGFIDFNDKNFMDGGTFTTTLGNFTKIEVSSGGYCDVSGTGWSGNSEKMTWTGNASSVSFIGDIMGMGNTQFVFTIAEPTVAVTGVTLNQNEAQMTVGGETLTLTATVNPNNATDQSVSWSTSDANVATVENGVVTAVAAGNATITVTTTDGSFTATCDVTVSNPAPQPEPQPTTVTWGASEFSSFGVDYLHDSRTVKGITVTVNAATNNFINVTEYGTTFNATIDNAFTFSTELGNITKIECTTLYTKGTLGDGWTIGANSATWEGNTNTLNFGNAGSMLVVSNIIFTIGGGSTPAPAEDVNITPNVDPENDDVYYSTFYDSANKYALPAGVEAYIVTTVSGDAMQLQKVADAGQTIPAGEGVILKASVTPFTLTLSDADAVSVEGNRLEGSDISIATPANCYVLAGNDGVGFYHYNASMLNPHKAYIIYAPNSGNQAPHRLRFAFDQATGVENVQGDHVQSTKVIENGVLYIIKNGVKYNAQGQVVK